jgi:ketosteroid isomerase-like protein
MAALKVFWTAIVAGTPQALDPVLAPEYQVERADGSGMDRAAYLKSELPKVAAMPDFTSVNVTGAGDLLVVRYYVTVNSTRKGKVVVRHAPRLTVFHKQGDSWLVVAHANFATLAK